MWKYCEYYSTIISHLLSIACDFWHIRQQGWESTKHHVEKSRIEKIFGALQK
jgi:hypothetical protein